MGQGEFGQPEQTNGLRTAQHYLSWRATSPPNNVLKLPGVDGWTDEETTITSDMHRGYVVPDGWDEVHFVAPPLRSVRTPPN